jgi:hypothetical protein
MVGTSGSTPNDVPRRCYELEIVEWVCRLIVVADFCWSYVALGTRRRHSPSTYIRTSHQPDSIPVRLHPARVN